MPAFTYTGEDARYYPTLAVEAQPGQTTELAANPGDGRWEPAPVNYISSAAPSAADSTGGE
ncbi:hypothetical protein AB0H73_00235 [Streptomyces olivoreticuli]